MHIFLCFVFCFCFCQWEVHSLDSKFTKYKVGFNSVWSLSAPSRSVPPPPAVTITSLFCGHLQDHAYPFCPFFLHIVANFTYCSAPCFSFPHCNMNQEVIPCHCLKSFLVLKVSIVLMQYNILYQFLTSRHLVCLQSFVNKFFAEIITWHIHHFSYISISVVQKSQKWNFWARGKCNFGRNC